MTLPRIVVVTGPTGSGKTAFSLEIAAALGAEIVSADSMQIYRGLDIGTAKPTAEELRLVPHHLIDVVDIDEPYNAGHYRRDAMAATGEVAGRGKPCLVVGGSPLYIKVLLEGLVEGVGRDEAIRGELAARWEAGEREGLWRELKTLDPASAEKLHVNDRTRIIRALEIIKATGELPSALRAAHNFSERGFEALILGMDVPRPLLYRRIEERVDAMLAAGWVEEVRRVLSLGYPPELPPLKAVGYREICDHLLKGVPLPETAAAIKQSTRNLAKRQLTWMRKMDIRWTDPGSARILLSTVKDFFTNGHGTCDTISVRRY